MHTSFVAHGKVILLGEHSVVYGYDALAIPIKALHIKTTVEANSDGLLMKTRHYQGLFLKAPHEYDGLKYVVQCLQQKANRQEALTITYTGEIPTERGLGSSATVALGTTHALNDYYRLRLTHEQIMAVTNHAEMINHGKASGLDAATVNSDHALFFNTKNGAHTIKTKLGATLLIMDTGDLGNTKQAVTQVQQLFEQDSHVRENMKILGQLTDSVKRLWDQHNLKAIGSTLNIAQAILSSFGVSTAKIAQLCQLSLSNGALGAKLSGGGLGGIVIALCSNHQIANQIAQKSQPLITHHWIEEI